MSIIVKSKQETQIKILSKVANKLSIFPIKSRDNETLTRN